MGKDEMTTLTETERTARQARRTALLAQECFHS